MKTIFDFGMYDASDTIYYLQEGFKVVAVEANPALVDRARSVLGAYLKSGQLEIVNAAISSNNEKVELTVCGDDLGSSSIYQDSVSSRTPLGKFAVSGITTLEIFQRFGVPFYLKVDLEGADRLCVESLTAAVKPDYLSFEMGDDFESLLTHVASIGFSKFKIINQCNLRELSNQDSLRDRLALKIVRILGFAEPRYVRRGGQYFKLGHSSGPVPWKSDGGWCSHSKVLKKWKSESATNRGNVWYDLHAV